MTVTLRRGQVVVTPYVYRTHGKSTHVLETWGCVCFENISMFCFIGILPGKSIGLELRPPDVRAAFVRFVA